MKKMMLLSLISLMISACASTVTTYDANGKMIGSCHAERGFIIGGGANCIGSANQEGRLR